MSVSSELNAARKTLSEFLGSEIKIYYSYMKLWFSGETTKEEFDIAARNLLQPDGIRIHNDFLLAILNRCDIPSEPSSTVFAAKDSVVTLPKASKTKLVVKKEKTRKKAKISRPNFEHRFHPVNPMLYASSAISKDIQEDETLGLCSREMTLPDIPMLHGRMFLIAWDTGLEDVEDITVKLMQQAVEWVLKGIIEKMLCRRNGYKLRDGCFKYAVGFNRLIRIFKRHTRFMTAILTVKLQRCLSKQCKFQLPGLWLRWGRTKQLFSSPVAEAIRLQNIPSICMTCWTPYRYFKMLCLRTQFMLQTWNVCLRNCGTLVMKR